MGFFSSRGREDVASEAALVRRVLRALNAMPQTRAVKMHGSRYGRVGDPDIWGSSYGQIFLLEMKTPGKKPRKSQLAELAKWRRAGATVGWFDDAEGAIELVRSMAP